LIAAFFALYVIWGSTYLVIRIGVEYWPPLLLAGIRFCTAGALMYAFFALAWSAGADVGAMEVCRDDRDFAAHFR
jgi:drug/metabolite transporter (DMT)-like permease